MRALTFLIAIILCSAAHAQDTPKFAVKGYLNYSWVNRYSEDILIGEAPQADYTRKINNHILNRPNPTIAFFTKNGFHEVELINLQIGSENDKSGDMAYKIRGLGIFARYEYALKLFRKSDKQLTPYLGFAISPLTSFSKLTSYDQSSSWIDQSFQVRGVFSVVPRLTMTFGKRIFLDLNSPIDYLNIDAIFDREKQFFDRSPKKTFILVKRGAFPAIVNFRIGGGIKF